MCFFIAAMSELAGKSGWKGGRSQDTPANLVLRESILEFSEEAGTRGSIASALAGCAFFDELSEYSP